MKEKEIQRTLYEIECPLCERTCNIRLSKVGNPYFSCPDCGLRCFVNSPSGKERLAKIAWEREDEDVV